MSDVIFQGKIGEAKRRDGTVQEIHVYINSQDFPNNHLLILCEREKYGTERVPISEEIWQKIGTALKYRFKKSKEIKELVK